MDTPTDKIAKFDALHAQAVEHLRRRIARERDKDVEQQCFSAVMELLGPDVWDIWNQHEDS